MTNNIRTYSELILLPTFHERFEYLKLDGSVGRDTFGFDRFLNQEFYSSPEWKRLRSFVIARDNGCDLALDGYSLDRYIIVHHMNPVAVEDIVKMSEFLMNPEYLVCVSRKTHNAIHYGCSSDYADKDIIVERYPNDTAPWKVRR